MSLDTVLKIGKALRTSKGNLKHFKYVKPCPKDKNGEYLPTCVSIPIREDFSIDWNAISLLPENEKEALYYLTFKTSDGDSSVKYLFGDIYYGTTSTLKKDKSVEKKERGFYKLGNPNGRAAQQKNSFERGQSSFEELLKKYKQDTLVEFRKSFSRDNDVLAKVLSSISAVEEYLIEGDDLPFIDFLKSESKVFEATVKRVYEKTSRQILNKLNVKSEFPELSEEEKKKLAEFDNGDIFIHFEFPEKQHWYQFKHEFDIISGKILEDFVEKSSNGVVLRKTLYKTICSGDLKNDWQFPGFSTENKHKSKAFTDEEIKDLFYAIDYSSRGRTIQGTDFKIILLPKGKNLTAEHFEEFVKKRDEERLKKNNQSDQDDDEPLFNLFEREDENEITSFDLVFCKKGGTSSPDVDLLEISGIEKSKIRFTKKRLEKISSEIQAKRKAFLRTDKNLYPFKIEYSFRNILGDPLFDQKSQKVSIKANPKYQSHILKVLPLIYMGNYHQDQVLLPAFIRNIEYSIRSGDNKFNLLKFDFEYLLKIQNSSINKFEIMVNSKSYLLGKQLGQMAKPLRKAINSFEKSSVGLITRRVATKYDCIKFTNEITEKLTRHGKRWAEQTANVVSDLSLLPEAEYDKELVAFGFLGGYFTYEEESSNTNKFYSKLEKLLNDFHGNEELEQVIEGISNITTSELSE